MTVYVVFGASRGLGDAFISGLPVAGDTVVAVSRTEPSALDRQDGVAREWLRCDLSRDAEVDALVTLLSDREVDKAIYNAGIWEQQPFAETSDQELRAIVTVNVTSMLILLKALRPALTRSSAPHVLLVGSTSGLENEGTSEVGYAATKFAARGVAHSLREDFRPHRIPVTCLNIGATATDIPWKAGPEAALSQYDGERMPVEDVLTMTKAILGLSRAACVKEVDMPALANNRV